MKHQPIICPNCNSDRIRLTNRDYYLRVCIINICIIAFSIGMVNTDVLTYMAHVLPGIINMGLYLLAIILIFICPIILIVGLIMLIINWKNKKRRCNNCKTIFEPISVAEI
jgi:hypothetical protein